MKPLKLRLALATMTGLGMATISIVPAFAGDLTSYDSDNYTSKLATHSCNGASMYDVADDRVNSIKNQTACNFSARSWNWLPNTTIQIVYVAKGSSMTTLGSKNNQIDHYDKR